MVKQGLATKPPGLSAASGEGEIETDRRHLQ
jgi:hypothetical protein